jgi:D-alanyl-lipoteichoic acid acyltransferase DltB (MBOAT superfamily)
MLLLVLFAMVGFWIPRVIARSAWQSAAVWLYALAILLFKESYRLQGSTHFAFLVPLFDSRRYGGIYRWQLAANFLVLRIISYSFDYSWARTFYETADTQHSKDNNVQQSVHDGGNSRDQEKLETRSERVSQSLWEYSFLNYCSYVFYAPLYMAGPIITFDSFMKCSVVVYSCPESDEQLASTRTSPRIEAPQPGSSVFRSGESVVSSNNTSTSTSTSTSSNSKNSSIKRLDNGYRVSSAYIAFYLVRWVLVLLLLEFMLHRFPFFAVVSSGVISQLSAAQIAVLCYVLLKMMWLKFLLIWRFFRLWALAEGVVPPENMSKCMSNNYSLAEFWKGWHSSFNLWLVRYLYKPLGGRNMQFMSVWPIFLFVALWHDMELKLALWGLLNAFFYVVEVGVRRFVAYTAVLEKLPAVVATLVSAGTGALYIIVLIGVNLTGYAVGVGGISLIAGKLYSSDGFWTLGASFYFLSVGVLTMKLLKVYGYSK